MTAIDETAWRPGLRESYLFDRNVIAEIQRAAREGIYDIRGFGAKRRVPHFDDLLPSRYGMNPDDLRRADAIEIVVGQGAKPGGGGMLLGHKISDRVAEMRDLPKGIDQRSASRHPDWTGPDDLEIKIVELREITDWEKPVFVKVGATRTYYDVQLAVKAGADVIVVDGMQDRK